ncbi:hypothetical protein PVAND_015165 [Polypedilum vanderplanki]|uniref:Ankyrin repeat protein n=1 Tax=Polypedilum vanderplanki TaxID=319348 RepID=A0A9J6BBU4_POLVA|nr:hypothetical protein PVAND_015165 [Polypedilum vanderplanki]
MTKNSDFEMKICPKECKNIHEILEYVDNRGYNFLMIAAEKGNKKDLLKYIQIGINVNSAINSTNAAILAYNHHHFECLTILLQNNSIFPSNFNANNTENESLIKFEAQMLEFHHHLKNDNRNELTQIILENSNLRHFYNNENSSAPTIALKEKNYDLYEYLIEKNITIGPFEVLDYIFDNMTDEEQNLLKEIHERHSIGVPERHMMILEASTFVNHDEENLIDKRSTIRHAYEILNKIDQIRPLLIIIALSRCFKIIMDFNSEHTRRMDPTTERNTKGVYYATRHIYVGAKNLSMLDIVATLAHEFCHYVMDIIYENDCKPYKYEDRNIIGRQFHNILKHCRAHKNEEELIELVFYYENSEQHAELIVRVPHMIVKYFDDGESLENRKLTFKALFDFYENEVLSDVKEQAENIEKYANDAVRRFAHGMKTKVSKWKKISLVSCLMFCLSLILTYFLVPDQEILCENLNLREKEKMLKSEIEYFGTNVSFSDFFDNDTKNCGNLTIEELRSVIDKNFLNYTKITIDKNKTSLNFQWQNLPIKMKIKILNTQINFQGEFVEFYTILNLSFNGNFTEISTKIEEILNILSATQINQILQENNFEIHEKVPNFVNYFYKLDFVDEENRKISYEFLPQESNLILLADYANSGKTTTFRYIAQKIKENSPTTWVFYVDLKFHLDVFKKKPENFLSIIFNLKNFDEILFESFQNVSKIVIFWDGIDEISPYFKDFMIEQILKITEKTNIQQWISTRLELKKELQLKLNCSCFSFETLTESKRREFVQNYLEFVYEKENEEYLRKFNDHENYLKETKSENSSDEDAIIDFLNELEGKKPELNEDNDSKMKRFIINWQCKKVEEIHLRFDSTIGFSVMIINLTIKMSQQSEEMTFYFTSRYNVYKEIIKQKLSLLSEKGEIIKNIDYEARINFDIIMSLHQYLAIKMMIGDNLNLNIMDLKNHINDEKFIDLNRYGFVFFESFEKFTFMHRTYAEFFLANYLVKNILEFYGKNVNQKELNEQFKLLKLSMIRTEVIRDFLFTAETERKIEINKFVRCTARKNFDENNNQIYKMYMSMFFRNHQRTLFELWNIKRNYFDDCLENSQETKLPIINETNVNKFYPNQKGQIYFMANKFGFSIYFTNLEEIFVKGFSKHPTSKKLTIFFENILPKLTIDEKTEIFLLNFDDIFKVQEKVQNIQEYLIFAKNSVNLEIYKTILLNYTRNFYKSLMTKEGISEDKKKFLPFLFDEGRKNLNVNNNLELICSENSILIISFYKNLPSNFIIDIYGYFKNHTNEEQQKTCLLFEYKKKKMLKLALNSGDENLLKYFIDEYKRIFTKDEIIDILTKKNYYDKFLIRDLQEISNLNAVKLFMNFLKDFLYQNRIKDLVEILSVKLDDGSTIFNHASHWSANCSKVFAIFIDFLKKHLNEDEIKELQLEREFLEAIIAIKKNEKESSNVIKFLYKYRHILSSQIIYKIKPILLENSQNLTSIYVILEKFLDGFTENCSKNNFNFYFISQAMFMYDIDENFYEYLNNFLNDCDFSNFSILLEFDDRTDKYQFKDRAINGFFIAHFIIKNFYGDNENFDQNIIKNIPKLFFDLLDAPEIQDCTPNNFNDVIFIINDYIESNDVVTNISSNISQQIQFDLQNFIKNLSGKNKTRKEYLLKAVGLLKKMFEKNDEILKTLEETLKLLS